MSMSSAAGEEDAAAARLVLPEPQGGSYQDACLDLFLLVVDAHTPPSRLRLHQLLAAAWAQDALTALKLVCNLRVRGAGKEAFYAAALWMHRSHPRTLAGNLAAFADLGFIEDFPELLYRLVVSADPAARKRARNDDDSAAASSPTPTAININVGASKKAALKAAALAAKARSAYENDRHYRSLFDSLADFFSARLRSDLKHLKDGNPSKIGLTAKWCPRPDSAFDQTTLLSDAIGRRLFPRGSTTPPPIATVTGTGTIIQQEDDDKEEEQERRYTLSVRTRLRSQVLAPLAPHLPLPQAANKKAKLLPHEILRCLVVGKPNAADTKQRAAAAEKWDKMVAEVRGKGSLLNCMALCHFSPGGGLFKGKQGMVCVALALLISELGRGPWEHRVCACTDRSFLIYLLAGKPLVEKVDLLRNLECGRYFSLKTVFQNVLTAAKGQSQRIKAEDLVKTIFVFSDKDFDRALVPPGPIMRDEDFVPGLPRLWMDEYEIQSGKFTEAGYAEYMPQVVFWNLCGQRSAALTSTKDGIMRLSGYSDDLLNLFLEKSGLVHPEHEMYAAIAGEEYKKLQVFD